MIRMLIIGYCFGIRSERRLCEEVHLNLAYRWFCRLGLVGQVPDHSTFSKNRHGRFRQSDLLRRVFETVLQRQDRIFGSDRIIVRLAKGCRLAFQRTTSPRPQAHPGTAPTLICRS